MQDVSETTYEGLELGKLTRNASRNDDHIGSSECFLETVILG
jgi:hypothetical protein